MLLFPHLLFKPQSFQQLQQNQLMPTCQLLPCMKLEKPFLQLSQFHPTPGRHLMENPAVDKLAHGPVQVRGVLLPICKVSEAPSSPALEAVQLDMPGTVLNVNTSYSVLAWLLFLNISENEISSSDEWLTVAGHIITSSKFFSLRPPKQRFDNDILYTCRDSSRLKASGTA